MDPSSPEEVLKSISRDFKLRGLTHEEAAKRLGFGSKQTLSNLLSSRKYLSAAHAQRFNSVFKYEVNFLMFGVGPLYAPGSAPVLSMSWAVDKDGKTVEFSHLFTSPSSDFECVMNWFLRLVQLQKNADGIALWHEVYKYLHAKESAMLKLKMNGVSKSDEDFESEFEYAVGETQRSIIETIENLLDGIVVKNS